MTEPMKGSQGLDALAELCGGATKAQVSGNETTGGSNGPTQSPSPESATPPASHVGNIPGSTGQLLSRFPESNNNTAKGQHTWEHAVANAASFANTPAAALLSANPRMPNTGGVDASAFNAMQQLAYIQYFQAQAAAVAQAQIAGNQNSTASVGQLVDPTNAAAAAAAALVLSGQPAEVKRDAPAIATTQEQQIAPHAAVHSMQKIIPGPPASSAPSASTAPEASGGMHPPAPPSQVPSVPSIPTSSMMLATPQAQPGPTSTSVTGNNNTIVPLKPQQPDIAPQKTVTTAAQPSSSPVTSADDKKQLKRAANRRSAQLSRKRKKLFIEELKEENDELRRKEQILRSIPDMIVVFDSAGKMWFVSESVSRLISFKPQELEGNSFWDRLCDESVRLLKAAFMDALAARQNDMATAPLGSGVWELRLVDKDGSHKVVTLNGVVHFSKDSPECVCSIRPRDENQNAKQVALRSESVSSSNNQKTLHHSQSSSSSDSSSSAEQLIRSAIQPHQSVISNGSSDDSVSHNKQGIRMGVVGGSRGVRRATQISDDDSCVSESGSD